jgi:hypothetical protein
MLKRHAEIAAGAVKFLTVRRIPAALHHVKKHLEPVIHVQLLVAMEQRQPLLRRRKIGLNLPEALE